MQPEIGHKAAAAAAQAVAGRLQMQARLGHLRLSAEVCAAGAASLAALSALRRHLMRLHADSELASAAHVVRAVFWRCLLTWRAGRHAGKGTVRSKL